MSLLNISETAQVLRVAKSTVASTAWRKKHGLKSFHIGNRVVFKETDVNEFIEEKQKREGGLETQ